MPDGRRRQGRPLHVRDLLRRPLVARRDGHAGDVDLSGLAAAFVIRYDDDEPGSPWSFVVHVDERGSERAADGARRDPDRRARRRGRAPAAVGVEAERAARRAREPDRDRRQAGRARAPVGRAVSCASTPSRPTRSSPADPRLRQARHRALADELVVDDARSPGSSAATAPSRARSTTRRRRRGDRRPVARAGEAHRTISPSTTSAYAVCS